MNLPVLHGDSIDLHCGSVAHVDAESRDVAELCAMLGVRAPPQWPPQHNDEATRTFFRTGILLNPGSEPWWCYYVVRHEEAGDILAGLAGYTGPPKGGVVDVGYSILSPFQRRGIASEAVRLLIDEAFARDVAVVGAETLPDHVASQGVMKKNGMTYVGERPDHQGTLLWRFERRRDAV